MRKNSTRRIIVVLGMHRSGTSAITRALVLLGVELGNDLHPAGFDNPKGFWEDRSVLELNEQLLKCEGSAYDRLGLARADLKAPIEFSSLKLKATQLIARKLKESAGVWGFKDPRTCRLLSFWMEVFKAVGCEVSFVIVVRNPASVVASLGKRNNIAAEKGYVLWLQHMLPAVLRTDVTNRVVVDYDKFMDAPYEQIARIASALSLPCPARNHASVVEFENDFLVEQLRHTRYTLPQLLGDNRAPGAVHRLYQLLASAAIDRKTLETPSVTNALQKLDSNLSSLSPLIDYCNFLEDAKQDLERSTSARDGQIATLNQVVAEREGQIATLNQVVAERQEHIGRLNQAVAERDGQIAGLTQVVAERDGQVAGAMQELFRVRSELASVLGSRSWRLTKPLRVFRRHFVSAPYWAIRRGISAGARWLWRHQPLSVSNKQQLKNTLFTTCPILFSRTEAYRAWHRFTGGAGDASSPDHTAAPSVIGTGSGSRDAVYVPLSRDGPPTSKPARIICFYLPQFHAIPENDAWWGEGFTEWTNVRPAQPQFAGHYQPRTPGELGYYNLLDVQVQRRQVELAMHYGIEGFCFYLYWFSGKRLLDSPIENYLSHKELALPYCLCWANENWSRRWDGLDSEVLVAQQYSPEDDLAFIRHVSRYMRDPRYIRVNGKPLLMVYRPSLLPSAKETGNRWRDWCRANGIGEIYLAYTQSFEAVDPARYGFDAAIEFPPNNSGPPNITDSVQPLGEDCAVAVYDWRALVERSERYKRADYKLFRGVCPGWDNTARRKNRGTVFLNNTPALYQRWLENAIRDTEGAFDSPDERLIFVNAWNEWAESAYLEPDQRYGCAYLQATRDALTSAQSAPRRSILLITHDCHPHGAQFLTLAIARQLKGNGFAVHILALDGGRLLDDFRRIGKTINAKDSGARAVREFLFGLRSAGTEDAITSTVVSGYVVPQLKELGFRVLSLIHELPGVIRAMKQEVNAERIARHADKIVFPADVVYKRFCEVASVEAKKAVIRHQGVLRKNPYKNRRAEARRVVCKKHKLPDDAQIVLSIAYADHRKGPDLFVEMAAEVLKSRPKTTFIWIGHADQVLRQGVVARIEELGLKERVLFIDFERDPSAYYAAASVYALTSREDPFPNVVLESAEVGVPVVTFDGATGAGDFVVKHGGLLARHLDTRDFADRICDLLSSLSDRSPEPVGSLQQYVLDLLHHLNGFPRVSAIVPNYNYERYIAERLDSICGQTLPVYEVIILDDCSSDKSVERIQHYIDHTACDVRLHVGQRNSGSVFRQWKKGLESSKGDILWIAEADDLAESRFLEELAFCFNDRDVVLAYCQSKQMDKSDRIVAGDYLDYTKAISDRWLASYTRAGREEIGDALSIKNTIPNVSAVLFRRDALERAFTAMGDELVNYRFAGDWMIYLHVLLQGKIHYSKDPLNLHRRHAQSVTNSGQKMSHLNEVLRAQKAAQSMVAPPEEALHKAAAYVQHLHDYLGIPKNTIAESRDAASESV